ncbi:hypothetical protein [Methylobacterium sp. 1973]|jgi:Flp pilus assembly pilin Flp|uniref:Flp family type IVb pilin n=1 Tax=Methylobacterium sp. 1973 TaxID=3156421 RepID=UPI0006AF9DBF|nr:hypothetical protein ADL19_02470 [Streptomyces purpurogeneiscleroticus]
MDEPGGGEAGRRAVRIPTAFGLTDRIRAEAVRFVRDVHGSTAMEYALLGGMIFLVAVGSIRYYVSRVSVVYGDITAAVTQGN